jgi:hypothetical protein
MCQEVGSLHRDTITGTTLLLLAMRMYGPIDATAARASYRTFMWDELSALIMALRPSNSALSGNPSVSAR